MMNIKYFLFLTLVAFSYQLSHCLQSHKVCNPFGSSNVPQCTIGFATQCYECQIGYSVSNTKSSCLNIANCAHFDEDGDCDTCDNYYNFDDKGNCVNDHCMLYNDDEDGGKAINAILDSMLKMVIVKEFLLNIVYMEMKILVLNV